jgi:hypothetical protein
LGFSLKQYHDATLFMDSSDVHDRTGQISYG